MSTAENAITDHDLNRAAELLPATEPMCAGDPFGPPALRVDDAVVFVYVDRDDEGRRRLTVSVDLDDIEDPELIYGPDRCVRMRVNVGDSTVFVGDEDGERAGLRRRRR